MFVTVYVSAARTWPSDPELEALLAQSRPRNAAAGITGLLLYRDGNFMQALEGDETAVRALVERIRVDPRHHGLLVLDEAHAEARQFEGWSMGFARLDRDAAELPSGFGAFAHVPLTAAAFGDAPARCWQLLDLFRRMP